MKATTEAIREAQTVLEAQPNANHATVEAAWHIERYQAHIGHRKHQKKPTKIPRPMRITGNAEEGCRRYGGCRGFGGCGVCGGCKACGG